MKQFRVYSWHQKVHKYSFYKTTKDTKMSSASVKHCRLHNLKLTSMPNEHTQETLIS